MNNCLTSFVFSRRLWVSSLSVLAGLILSNTAHAQYIDSQEELKSMTFKQRLYFGGMLGGGFGTITSVQVMPVVGYRINHRWSAGVGANYQYYKDNRPPSFDTHIYGGNAHTRVFILEMLFAHSEFEMLSLETLDRSPPDFGFRRLNIPAWFIGAGYYARIGQKSGIAVTFLYDLIQDVNSPYPGNYTLRMGFVF